jgi:peptidoglycan hydrolase-like protein with peptidoglycan-binding domain
MKKLILALGLLLSFTLVAAACGDDDDTSSSDTSSSGSGADPDAVAHTEMSAEELEIWQSDLAAVKCYPGAIDGANGPQTEAAVKAYQSAKGLTVDGLLGPQTEGALKESVAAGETVCTTSDEAAASAGSGAATATLSSANYGPITFALGTCSLSPDPSSSYVTIEGQANNLSISADVAPPESGTLSVDGGTESDGITLNGTITDVEIAVDNSFTATGEFGEPNNVGETFTLAGSCP